MTREQKQLIKLLDAGIHGKKVTVNDMDWDEFIKSSESHKIVPIVYSAIDKSSHKTIASDKLKELKIKTFNNGVYQLNHINKVAYVLDLLNKNNIKVIVLKGLVVRELYPNPEMRSMCDADILVKHDDLEKTRELLFEIGYVEHHTTEAHLVFTKPGCPVFEIHWTLITERYFRGDGAVFEERLWERAIEVQVKGINTLSLCIEDLTIHLILHMALHMASCGFGIRQLADLVLLVEKKGYLINWNNIVEISKEIGIGKFTNVIFKVCNKLFNLSIPDEVDIYDIDDKQADKLISLIINNGVYGKEDAVSAMANIIAYDKDDREVEVSRNKIIFKTIFPSVDKLGDKYNYAKKHKYLSGIAWAHHLLSGMFRPEYRLKDKFKVVLKGPSAATEKNELLHWLEL